MNGTMRCAIEWTLFTILLLAWGAGCTRSVGVGDPAPAFRLEDLAGAEVSLEDYRGRVLTLHFWATWCPPCLEELPAIARFFGNAESARFALLAVCVDRAPPGKVREFLSSWGLSLPVAVDPGGAVARDYGTFRFPETYVIDRQGVIRRKVVGVSDWRNDQWVRFLQKAWSDS